MLAVEGGEACSRAYLPEFLTMSARALSNSILPLAPLAVTSATHASVTVWPTFFQLSSSDLGITLVVFFGRQLFTLFVGL